MWAKVEIRAILKKLCKWKGINIVEEEVVQTIYMCC